MGHKLPTIATRMLLRSMARCPTTLFAQAET